MKRLFWRLAPEVVLVPFLVASAGGCNPNQSVEPGPPKLLTFSVVDNVTGQPVELTDDAGAVEITGFVHLSALFDRLLDPVPVTSLDGGVDQGANVTMVTIAPPLPSGASVTYTSIYTPNGAPLHFPGSDISGGLVYGPGPTINTTVDPTFPSGSTITFSLDGSKVRSKKGEPFTGMGQLMFHTQPFAAAIAVPLAEADPDAGTDAGAPAVKPEMQAVTVSFTNLPAADIDAHIHVTVGGAPFADVTVAPDAMGNPTVFTVTPTTSWPGSSTITVTVDATAADALGSPVAAAASGSFTTGSN